MVHVYLCPYIWATARYRDCNLTWDYISIDFSIKNEKVAQCLDHGQISFQSIPSSFPLNYWRGSFSRPPIPRDTVQSGMIHTIRFIPRSWLQNLGTVFQFLFREFLIWTFLYAIISTSYRLYVGFINSLSPDDPNRNSYVKAG